MTAPGRWLLLLFVATVGSMGSAGEVKQPLDQEQLRGVVAKSVALVQASAETYTEERDCFSCHHQSLPAMLMETGRDRGWEIDSQAAQRQSEFTLDYFAKRRDRVKLGKDVPGGSYSVGYALAGLAADGWPADETTAALVEYLLVKQHDDGHWAIQTHRPPLEDSDFTATALAVRGLHRYAPAERMREADARISKARGWLLKNEGATHEDQIYRLLGLHWSGCGDGARHELATKILKRQQADGGWSQIEGNPSDAYATGQALVAMHQTGELSAVHTAFQSGVKFLLAAVRPDGSWNTVSRSKPFQTYFESGYPHGKDQFISIAGGCWATMALLLALDDPPAKHADAAASVVYRSGEGDYHTYRIPACVTTRLGTVLAFCEGRRNGRSDSGNIDVVLCRSIDGGRAWQPPLVVADDGEHTIGNPCSVVDRTTGRIWLLLTRNHGEDKQPAIEEGKSLEPRTVWACSSDDDGLTWTKPVQIPQARESDWGWNATGPGCGIQLDDGRLLIPCHHTTAKSREQRSHALVSDDGGATWQLAGIAATGTGESAVAQLSDGRLVINIRAHPQRTGARLVATSSDRGATWSSPQADKALADPGCQGSLLALRRPLGAPPRLVFANPASETRREQLTVRLSTDDGQTWSRSKVLHSGPAGYSCLTELADGSLGCLAECGEQGSFERLTFFRFRPESISVSDSR